MDMIQLQIEYRLKETYLDRILILQEIRHEEEQKFENDEMGKTFGLSVYVREEKTVPLPS